MRVKFAKVLAAAWHPTDDDPDARIYRSDVGVTSGGAATRNRFGSFTQPFCPTTPLVGAIDDSVTSIAVASTATFKAVAPYEIIVENETMLVTAVAGTTLTVTRGYAASTPAAHANGAPARLAALDGQTLLQLPSGRLVLLGGAINGHAGGPDERVNIIWASDDRARTWSVLLGDAAGSSTRPARGHTFGGFIAKYGGMPYVYWLGGDPFYPTGDVFRIPASALDVGGDPNTPWERISTTCPTSALALFMYGQLGDDGDLVVIGGQVDINDGAASKKVFKSTDQGATWAEVGTNLVPSNVLGQQLGALPYKDGKLWICGSGRYHSTVNDFSNAVVTFDGAAFVTVLADGHSQFPKSRYHSCVLHNGRLWRFNGTTWDGVTRVDDTRSAHSSVDGINWTAWTAPIPWPNTHAQAAVSADDGIYLTSGFQDGKINVIREHTGPLVSAWADQGSAAKNLAQSDSNTKPIFDAAECGGRGGLVFTKEQFLALAAKDANLSDGFFEVWIVAKTLSFDSSPEQGGPNPPCVFIGETSGSSWNNFGILGPDGELQYKQVSGGYQPNKRGSGYNDDRFRLLGLIHENGSLKFYVGDTQVGATVPAGGDNPVGFDATHTGWSAIGAGYLEADKAEMIVGAVCIRTTGAPSDAGFRTKLRTWAARWGAT